MFRLGFRYWAVLWAAWTLMGMVAHPALGNDNRDIENIREEFQSVLQESAALEPCLGAKIDPLKIKDLAARSFINRADWEKYLSDPSHPTVDPAKVYAPAPVTWDNWWEVENKVRRAADQHTPLTLEILKDWNQQALEQTGISGGQLKETPNYGQNVSEVDALDRDGIRAIQQFKLDGKRLLHWTSLVCVEQLPAVIPIPGENPECQQAYEMATKLAPTDPFWRQTLADMKADALPDAWYWYACWPRVNALPAEGERSCGMIAYPPASMARGTLTKLIGEVNEYFDPANTKRREEPIHFAMRIQQQAVALHPFPKGNGRNSRWIQDYITFRAGIPPILVPNMNQDLSTPLKRYVSEGHQGVRESLSIMEKCLGEYEQACRADSTFQTIQDGSCGLLK